MKILLPLVFFFGLHISNATETCKDVSCDGSIPQCEIVKQENPPIPCNAVVTLGGGTCRKFISCKIIKNQCQTVKQTGADKCVSCYEECKKAIDIYNISMEKRWRECITACGKKNNLSL